MISTRKPNSEGTSCTHHHWGISTILQVVMHPLYTMYVQWHVHLFSWHVHYKFVLHAAASWSPVCIEGAKFTGLGDLSMQPPSFVYIMTAARRAPGTVRCAAAGRAAAHPAKVGTSTYLLLCNSTVLLGHTGDEHTVNRRRCGTALAVQFFKHHRHQMCPY